MSKVTARYAHEEQCRKMRLPLTYDSDQNMVVPLKRGIPIQTPKYFVLLTETPKMSTLNFGKLPYLTYRDLTHALKPRRQLGFQQCPDVPIFKPILTPIE